MSTPFNPCALLVVVEAHIWGPTGDRRLRLALDTGAVRSVLPTALLALIGHDPATATQRVQFTTGSGVVNAPLVLLDRIEALGQSRQTFPVLAHTLPPTAPIDGLLGLDFLRGRCLTLDFRAGQIELV